MPHFVRLLSLPLALLSALGLFTLGMSPPEKYTMSDPNPKWHACEDVTDCAIIRGFCGYPEAVNKHYEKDYPPLYSHYADWLLNGMSNF